MRGAIASTLTASARPLAVAAPTHRADNLGAISVQTVVQCVWCGKDIAPNEAVIEIGGAVMHDRPCRDDFEAHVYGLDAYENTFDDGCDWQDAGSCDTEHGHVLDYARNEDRAIIERILRIPAEVE